MSRYTEALDRAADVTNKLRTVADYTARHVEAFLFACHTGENTRATHDEMRVACELLEIEIERARIACSLLMLATSPGDELCFRDETKKDPSP